MPIISPGLDKDWEILERKRTSSPTHRARTLKKFIKRGVPYGVNGEPFIPGFHTVKDFEDTIKWLTSLGIRRYNTYNLHFNDWVAKKFHAIGLDIELIWEMNQDKNWKPILRQLMDIAKKYNIILGCPDFVNTGSKWIELANTCCSVDVPNPTTWNTHYWKRMAQADKTFDQIIEETYDGSGDYNDGLKVILGTARDVYTLKDAGLEVTPTPIKSRRN
jgi:hypothetical protein